MKSGCSCVDCSSSLWLRALPPASRGRRCGAGDAHRPQRAVYTVDAAQPTAEAVAVRGDRIVLVGTQPGGPGAARAHDARHRRAAAPRSCPGSQDAHGHFTGLGASLQVLRLRGTTSYDQIVEMVRRARPRHAPGEWIQGRSWDQNDWPVKDWPTHDKLTAAAPEQSRLSHARRRPRRARQQGRARCRGHHRRDARSRRRAADSRRRAASRPAC